MNTAYTPMDAVAAAEVLPHVCTPMTPEHLEDVVQLSNAVWDDLEVRGHKDFASKKTPDELEGYIRSTRALGIIKNDKTVGFGYLGLTSPRTPDDGVPGMKVIYETSRTAVLRTGFVHPAFRRHGFGLKLVEERVALASRLGCLSVVTGVSSRNTTSWHNILRAGLRLVQVSPLPASISGHSDSVAFYFHKRLGIIECRTFGNHTLVEPVREHAKAKMLLEQGYENTSYETADRNINLVFSKEVKYA